MEDLLTSNVFGLLKYRKPSAALLPFLRLPVTPDGHRPFADLPDGAEADYEFWPQWRQAGCASCEPDVVLRIELPDGSKRLVVVEAKFHSGKSGEDDEVERPVPVDQLARQWQNLVVFARNVQADPVLVYLTADVGMPIDAIRSSEQAHRRTGGSDVVIAWLSWRHLEALLQATRDAMLSDLRKVLMRLGLTFFRGFSSLRDVAGSEWTFVRGGGAFSWSIKSITPGDWRFSH